MNKKIISIHSFRGGVGKSNVVANLAATMALQGKRVGIVDTDIQSPGIHVIFGFDEEKIQYSLNDYLWGYCQIQDTAYDVSHVLHGMSNFYSNGNGNGHSNGNGYGNGNGNGNGYGKYNRANLGEGSLYLIPSSIKAGEIARVLREGYDVGRLNDGFQELLSCLDLDYLLIDTHPGLNEETLLSIAISDVLVVILRPDRQDYQGTAVTIDIARKLEVPKTMLLVNKALSTHNFDALQREVQNTYNASVAGIVPLSEELVQLASSDIFCLRYDDHPFSRVVKDVAGEIIGDRDKVLVGGMGVQSMSRFGY
jgi:MinD-like ATPase involved in chromosome partitioning or flagellar assembly